MKKIILFFLSLVVVLVTMNSLNGMIGQKITVQKQTGEENNFVEFREVTKRKHVKKAINIMKNANWENGEVEMDRYADYRFQFPSKKNRNDKIASYLLWIHPNGQNLEIVTANQYVKLTAQDSLDLYKILVGKEFTNEVNHVTTHK